MKTPEHLARFPLAAAAFLSLGVAVSSAFGQSAADESPAKHPHATLSLVSASQSWHPGTPLLLAFNLDIEEGWHTYWRGISDTGQPPVFNLTLPEGFVAQPAVWPAPHREISTFVDALDHIYEHHLTVVVPVQTPAPGTPGAAAKSVHFKASGVWLVCKNACVPEKGEASLDLPQGAGEDASTHATRITSTLAQAGRPWSEAPSGASINHTSAADAATCTITVPGASWLAFYPDQHCLPMPSLFSEGEAKGPALRLTLAPKDDPEATRVTGLLEVRGLGDKPQFFTVDELVISGAPSKAAPPPESHK
ncbi:MAG: protein-disulfide reductase DsbD domain-containing protein [Phycisphaerales bacterium]